MPHAYLYSLVGVHDDGYEEAEYDVDEETDEWVEIDPWEYIDGHWDVGAVEHRKSNVHVVTVHKGEQTLRRFHHSAKLQSRKERTG